MTAVVTCRTCGAEPRAGARFCDACGAPIASTPPAEYKQVTVLFADVVRSMDIAAAEGPERLREIMADLLDRSTAVVKRYGGTLSQFTGDGIMAVFGAPITLEDHAFRACMAALDIQKEVGATLKLRIGLNSGQVIAGEIGSSTANYTTIGEQVGMAQRMESAAPPGGVMLSESTAHLVEDRVELGEPETVQIKGSDDPVPARQLLTIGEHYPGRRSESKLVGRIWELNTITAVLDEAICGAGCVVGVLGPPGIGKSRLVREIAATAGTRGVPVFTTYCESHARSIPFHVVARLLRASMGIDGLNVSAARPVIRELFSEADPSDLLLLDDLLGTRDPTVSLPEIAPDARHRRLAAMIKSQSLARAEPAIYVIEDAHWIDEASESMLADFLTVVPQTPSLTVITYRPEYRGKLTRMSGAQTLALRPLNDTQAWALTAQLLGTDPSLEELAAQIADRAAGNPFFVEEIVRDLAERGVVHGEPGAYHLSGEVSEVDVPATLHAAIGARVDRLDPVAKSTLNAAAVIGARFDVDMLAALTEDANLAALVEGELIDQVKYFPKAEYAFHHPLIRTVAYESQLRSDRARLHRKLAETIEVTGSADENAALIAEHLEAAGDLHAAFAWHMRCGAWAINRDFAAAHTAWRRARQVADRLPEDDSERMSMRIAPRTYLCATAARQGGRGADTGFSELRDLCNAAGDHRSLAIGMVGLVTSNVMNARRDQASRLSDEYVRLLDSIGDPTLTLALLPMAILAKHETAEMAEILLLSQRVIDLAEGELTRGGLIFGSPLVYALAMRPIAKACLGIDGWKPELVEAIQVAREVDPLSRTSVVFYSYVYAIVFGVLRPDDNVVRYCAETVEVAKHTGDNLAVSLAETALAISLVGNPRAPRGPGLDLLAKVRERTFGREFTLTIAPIIDSFMARERARVGDVDEAIELARRTVADLSSSDRCIYNALATSTFVELLLQRGGRRDVDDAKAAIDWLAATPTDDEFMVNKITLLRLRALVAQAQGDDASYRDMRDSYRKMANDLGFEGHMAWAEAMP
ncbi:MAG: ATP-binding protein [Mycobacterium sp.]|uniref:ATP-binding protein n=1 Tax=Mycobacterium sp. TaxID=1785 RepID=UPI00389A4409